MWKFKSFKQFVQNILQLDLSRKLLLASIFLLTSLYPGQNSIQTIILRPGPIKAYKLPGPAQTIYPLHDGTNLSPLTAKSIVVQDVGSKTIIFSKNPDTILFPASLTKIMTALVSLEEWQDLNAVITVKNEDRAIGQTIDLIAGEQLTLRSLLYGLLIQSGNDAALALADNYPGGYYEFVKAMNAKAQSLHLTNTTFKNPSGIDQYGHVTTSRDLAILASYAIENLNIREIVGNKQYTISDVTGQITHELLTTNQLLGEISGLSGLKTGWTSGAGECLISYVERDGNKIVVVVLGSTDRFGETRTIVDWVYAHHDWITPVL